MKKILSLAILASISASCTNVNSINADTPIINPYNINHEKYNTQADKLIAQMTLQEKIG
jgi:hypothetical protein